MRIKDRKNDFRILIDISRRKYKDFIKVSRENERFEMDRIGDICQC